MKRVEGFKNLYSRGGAYLVRVQVPERDRGRVGARELKKSLGSDFVTAKKKYPAVWAGLLARIEPTGTSLVAHAPHAPSPSEIDAAVSQYYRGLRSNIALNGPDDDGSNMSRREKTAALIEIGVMQYTHEKSNAMALQARWLCDDQGWDLADTSPQFREICTKLLHARLDRLREAQHKAVLSVGPQLVSDRRGEAQSGHHQLASDFHSANAAERRSR